MNNSVSKKARRQYRKLTLETVCAIRERYAGGDWTLDMLATHYGINQSHVWAIVHEKIWKEKS